MTDCGKLLISVLLVLALVGTPSLALAGCNCSGQDPDSHNSSSSPEALTCYVYCKSVGTDEFSDAEGYDSNETVPEEEPSPCSLPPVAYHSNLTMYENTPVELTLPATDPEGDNLTYDIIAGPLHGTTGKITGNKVVYNPDANYTGADSFSFRAHDGTRDSNTATVAITIEPDCSHHLPHVFYGTVTVNGAPATEYTMITAAGREVRSDRSGNPVAAQADGSYGSANGTGQYLVVQGCIEDGTPVSFSIDGIPAEVRDGNTSGPWQPSYPFRAGEVTNLDIRAPPAPPPPDKVYIKALGVTISNSTHGFSQTIKIDKNPWMELRVTGGVFDIEISATGVHQFLNGPVLGRDAILGIYENGTLISPEITVPFGTRKVSYEYVPTETRTFDILIYVNESPEIREVKQVTIHVVSGQARYNVTATAGTGGSISPAGQVLMADGAAQRFDIIPSYGYQIADVIVDGQSWGARTWYIFSNVQSDHWIHATFTEVPRHTITATAGTGGSISPAGQVSVVAGAAQRFDVTPLDGYQVADVMVDGQSKGAITSYTFSRVHADRQIHATFGEVSPAS